MVYCTPADVKLLVRTSMTDADLTLLIVEVDAEIDKWEADNSKTLSTHERKQVSMREAAILVITGEPQSEEGDYGQTVSARVKVWQKKIDEYLKIEEGEDVPFLVYTEPVD